MYRELSLSKKIAYLKQANIDSASELKLFIDSKELLRCGGRIHNATLTEMTTFHYFLPTNQQLTYLIVIDAHNRCAHAS